jgi:hypothetical protein
MHEWITPPLFRAACTPSEVGRSLFSLFVAFFMYNSRSSLMLCSNSFTLQCMRINTNYRTSKCTRTHCSDFVSTVSTQMSFFLIDVDHRSGDLVRTCILINELLLARVVFVPCACLTFQNCILVHNSKMQPLHGSYLRYEFSVSIDPYILLQYPG